MCLGPFLRTCVLVSAGLLLVPAAQLTGQSSDTLAFLDAGARALVMHALELRDSAAAGLASYEATATERTRVGMAVTRRAPLRDRTLYHREQVARVYWDRGGNHVVSWIGRREGRPMTGNEWQTRAPFGMGFDLAEELDLDDVGIDLLFDPLGDRIDFFDAGFIQPVSARGLRLYRFASGDTMQIRLPAPGRTITVVEVIVRPREKTWEAMEGSLWFDGDTGVLVRAAYRPSGVWDMAEREPGDLEDVPGFLKPAVGTVSSIVIEYGLYEQRWWLPRRVLGDGVMDWGHGLARMPLQIEWTLADHVINEAPGAAVTPRPGLLPAGVEWYGDNGRRNRVRYLSPEGVDLAKSSELPPPLATGGSVAFTDAELRPLLARLEQVAGPTPNPGAPALQRVLLSSLRFDRVRGLSARYSRTFQAAGFGVSPDVQLATAIPDVFGGLDITRGSVTLSAYRRLEDASDWNVAGGLGNSAATLLFGFDGGDYYRSVGGALTLALDPGRMRGSLGVFGESQRPISRQTNLSLANIDGGTLRPNLRAEPVDVFGVRAELAGQLGADVQAAVFNWRVGAEAATGETEYARALASLRVAGSMSPAVSAALELTGGLAGDGAPPQREFLLGGAGSLRGVRENALSGQAFWLARGELARGLPGLRALLFLDAGWAGPRDGFIAGRPTAGAGAGVSIMDGLLRADLARGVLRSRAWRVYFYLDGML